MSIYFRIHKTSSDPGILYNRDFQQELDEQPEPSDLVLSATQAQWKLITASRPSHVVLRVHEDRLNKDISEGDLYDENFQPAGKEILRHGNPVLFTVLPVEFEAVASTK